MKVTTTTKKILADTHTPVSIYLQLRDRFEGTLLLESSDYHSKDDSFSFICAGKLVEYTFDGHDAIVTKGADRISKSAISNRTEFLASLSAFQNAFELDTEAKKMRGQGLYGYLSYDAVSFFEDVKTGKKTNADKEIPLCQYALYEYVVVLNRFNDELVVLHNSLGEADTQSVDVFLNFLRSAQPATSQFQLVNGEEASNTEDEFLQMVRNGKMHCARGDVFQVVFSRRFSRSYKGDDFQLYRTLRSVNPSPYLFYFDYGNFRLFGSSPEVQLRIQNSVASIHPIAGTFRRTHNAMEDLRLAEELQNDPKEKSEHIMLVDLARNDLSRHCTDVTVKKFSEVQLFSHVIHLVSEVTGNLKHPDAMWDVVADTFPAGTLSGAPKVRAMQLIEENEQEQRGAYGGAIGMVGFDQSFNHAIMIRTFLSKNGTLFYQAGAGIVNASDEKKELQEVNNKLAALRKAMEMASN
jgi:anthranilate synthase component 1